MEHVSEAARVARDGFGANRMKRMLARWVSPALTRGVTRALLDAAEDLAVVLAFHGVLPEDELASLPPSLRRNFLGLSEFLRTVRALRSLGFEYGGLRELLAFTRSWQRATHVRKRLATITFDDGYESVRRHVFPILKEEGIPFVVCAIASCVERGELLWTNRARLLRHYAAGLFDEWVGDQDLKRLPNSQRTKLLDLCESHVEGSGCQVLVPRAYRPMSREDLRSLCQSGCVEVVFHTQAHPILSTVESTAALEEECSGPDADWVTCKEIFCIPNGLRTDVTPTVMEVLRRLGYHHWFTTEPGFVSGGSGAEEIPRIVARQTCFRTVVELTKALCRHMESDGRRSPSPQLRWSLDVASRLS